ncbi:MAG TPA: U32 family peptidase [Paracoccaceae bacterium]|nr:U32 family peptidase [Paracoccaceae bacterium]
MDLTLGPIQFFWEAARVRAFYEAIAECPAIPRVVLGEVVCSKRLPFWQAEIPLAAERLIEAGKEVWLSSLALVTLKRERKMTAELFETGLKVEIADLTALAHLPEGAEFAVGPLVNVYNIGTLEWLAERGARRICLPPELPPDAVARLAEAGAALGVAVEIWGFGRLPLAISGRCYHARLHGRSKDNCQFVCDQDPDGRKVDTLDGQEFLAVNGVQTLSAATAFAGWDIEPLRKAGVSALRLSPQSGDMAALAAEFARMIAGEADGKTLEATARQIAPGGTLANGYLWGGAGAEWRRPEQGRA